MKNDLDEFVTSILKERADEQEALAAEYLYNLEDFNKHTREAMKYRIAIKRIKENGL